MAADDSEGKEDQPSLPTSENKGKSKGKGGKGKWGGKSKVKGKEKGPKGKGKPHEKGDGKKGDGKGIKGKNTKGGTVPQPKTTLGAVDLAPTMSAYAGVRPISLTLIPAFAVVAVMVATCLNRELW